MDKDLAKLIATRADDRALPCGRRGSPLLASPWSSTSISKFARQNGDPWRRDLHPRAPTCPLLTLNQMRMVFHIAAAYGEEIDRDRAVEILAVIARCASASEPSGQRGSSSSFPEWAGPIKGGIAYAGTRALGKAAAAYFEAGRPTEGEEGQGAPSGPGPSLSRA